MSVTTGLPEPTPARQDSQPAGPDVAILFVDDEPPILKALKRVFRRFSDWQLYFASSPREAIEIISEHNISVLVSDHRMPQMTGAELPIASDQTPFGSHEIVLGKNAHLKKLKAAIDFSALGREGYVIRTVGSHLVIAGGDLRGQAGHFAASTL